MIKTVIFDFDGTLADTFQTISTIINSLAPKYRFPQLTQTQIDNLRSNSMGQLIKQFHISIFQLPKIIAQAKALQRQMISTQQLFPGIKDMLTKLKAKNYSLSIITSNNTDTVDLFLKKHNLSCFDYIHSDPGLFGKHRLISKFIKTHHFKPEEVIYVGDEIRDIEAAHKAKVKIVSVTWGFNSAESLQLYHPDHLIHHPHQLSSLLSA